MGTLTFTADRRLLDDTLAVPVSVDFVGTAQAINLDFGVSILEGGSGKDGTTAWGGTNDVTAQTEDGYPPGGFDCVDPIAPFVLPTCLPEKKTTSEIQIFANLDPTAPILGDSGGGASLSTSISISRMRHPASSSR
jgi:hypothetical protein